jgi:hypothetical protein
MSESKQRKRPERPFPVPGEVEELRAELLSAFQAGDLAAWSETARELKEALKRRRREMLTPARLKDIELNVGVWKEAAE